MSTKTTSNTRKLVPLNVTKRGAKAQENERELALNVVGQDEAREAALDAIARSRNPLRDKSRPIAIIYELGPSRSGKTLIAQMIAKILHGDKDALVKINGGNYKERHEVARLIGAPPGYLGHKPGDEEEKPGAKSAKDKHAKLTNKNLTASRKGSANEVTVVLIDEANLMHASFDDVLMSVMDTGELDMGNNDVTDFRNCIIILTSNIGMDEVHRKAEKRPIGFRQEDAKGITHEDVETTVKAALKERYRPEWLNRIDRFVVFKPHTKDGLNAIVDMELEKFYQRMEADLPRGQMFAVEVEPSAKAFLLASSLADGGNIAQLKREMQKHIIDQLGVLMENESVGAGDIVVVTHVEGEKSLSFFIAEGETFNTGGDSIEVHREDEGSQDGLAMQRRVARELRSQVKPSKWEVILEGKTEKGMIRVAAGLMQELTSIYGMKLLRHSYASGKPWTFIATVEATPGQIETFTAKEQDAKVQQVA